MLKSILHITLSSMLIFTILAPPLLTLMDIEVASITLKDEKKEKQEKELEEKTIFFNGLSGMSGSILDQKVNLLAIYNEDMSNFAGKIFLPPPEFIF